MLVLSINEYQQVNTIIFIEEYFAKTVGFQSSNALLLLRRDFCFVSTTSDKVQRMASLEDCVIDPCYLRSCMYRYQECYNLLGYDVLEAARQ